MHHLARRLFIVASALSVLLCAMAVTVRLFGEHGTLVLRRGDGGIRGGGNYATYALFSHGGWVGLEWTYSDVWFDQTLSLHLGIVLLITGMLGAWWAHFHLRRRRIAMAGLCTRCGYDLRATPNQCPECGATSKGVTV